MKFNEKIAYYRRDRKLSQEELAARVGVSRQAVSKWELGEASPEVGKLLALAKAFGVTTDHLLSEEEPKPAAPWPPDQSRNTQSAPGASLPGVIGRMANRWGWLAGIYIALQGVGAVVFGAAGRFIISNFFQEVGYIGFGGGDYMVLDDGSVVNWSGGFSGFQSALLAIPTIALVIGIIMILGGLSLAFVLWKNGKKRG